MPYIVYWYTPIDVFKVVSLFFLVKLKMQVPTGHTALLQRWINVNDVDSTSEQRREPSD